MRRRTFAGSGLAAVAALAVFTGTAVAVDGQLPGGTSISVDIATPAEDTVFPQGPVTCHRHGRDRCGRGGEGHRTHLRGRRFRQHRRHL